MSEMSPKLAKALELFVERAYAKAVNYDTVTSDDCFDESGLPEEAWVAYLDLAEEEAGIKDRDDADALAGRVAVYTKVAFTAGMAYARRLVGAR